MSNWTCFKLEGHVRESLSCMTQQLEIIFGELGIAQYLSAFLEQGFDSWETILDITESDLDALGVKLGHRRKLQRRIANSRGVAPGTSLATVIQQAEEARSSDNQRPEALRQDGREMNTIVVTKRKYRRHPKPDENAPERPPSAYVLFSNKMRDELKGRNLTFTEIAKLVGENWQSLSQAEKEPYESQAQAVKDKYHSDLAEYKKTPEYKKYMTYLQEFKAKHAVSSHDKEGSKRVKLEARNGIPNRRSRSASDHEDRLPSEPPANRQQRLDSAVSVKESPYSPSATPASQHASPEASIHSPVVASLDRQSAERSPTFSTSPKDLPLAPRRSSNWVEDQRPEHPGVQRRHLPSLSDVFDRQRFAPPGHSQNDPSGYPFPQEHMSNSPGPMPGLIGGDGRTPTLKKEDSVSTGSLSSSSSYGFPRTPIEGSLPIHALLASNSSHYDSGQMQSYFQGVPLPPDQKSSFGHQTLNSGGMPAPNGYHNGGGMPQGPAVKHHANHNYGPRPPATSPPQQGKDANLDGMSALLKAGEIVDRRAQ